MILKSTNMITNTLGEQIHDGEEVLRPCRLDDVGKVASLLKTYSEQNKLLPRDESDIYRCFREFIVIELYDSIVGCVALQVFTRELGEVRSFAVDPQYTGRGYGGRLLGKLENQAILIGLKKLMALTYVENYFHNYGYKTVDKASLPEKVWGVCINCHNFLNCGEIAVLKHL